MNSTEMRCSCVTLHAHVHPGACGKSQHTEPIWVGAVRIQGARYVYTNDGTHHSGIWE